MSYFPNEGIVYKFKTHEIFGWHNPKQEQRYRKLVEGLNNGIVVEVGVYGGASLLPIVEICQKTNTKIFGIDPWEKLNVTHRMTPGGQQISVDNCNSNQLKTVRLHLENIIKIESYEEAITLIHDFSQEASIQFKENTIDVLYLDGSHDYDAVLGDLESWFPKIKRGGVLLGDDWNWLGVRTAAQDYCKENKLNLEDIGFNGWKIIKQ